VPGVTRGNQFDAAVIGGGPAGSTAAQLLASWGWRTVLIHRAAPRPSLAESLPASARKLLAFLGQLSPVDAAGFHRNDGNIARWGGALRQTPTADAGFHVSRAAFDAVLRDASIAAGAQRIDAVVRRVEIGNPVRIDYASADQRSTLSARVVLDCSGRAGIVARRGWRHADVRYRTVAVTAEWESEGWPDGERTRTVVESFDDGWAWSIPLSSTRRQCTVMIDPVALANGSREMRGHSGIAALNDGYQSALIRTIELRSRLAGARQVGAPWACDSSIYQCASAADGNVLLVGDAASFIEPLSSAGVKKALLSAWRAAVVVNTCLKDASRMTAALGLYNQRERHVYAECMRRASGFFAEAAAAHRSPFWSARVEPPDTRAEPDTDQSGEWSDDVLAADARIRRAFEYLRGTGRVRLRPSSSLRVQPVAAIEGREVVLRDALVVPGVDAHFRFAAGIDLPALARLARGGEDVPTLIAAYQSHVRPAPVAGLLTGLSLLVAHRALLAEVPAAAQPSSPP
jgi:flavin-dependent dehydrogenase